MRPTRRRVRFTVPATLVCASLAFTLTSCGVGMGTTEGGSATTSSNPAADSTADAGPPTVVDPELGDVESSLNGIEADLQEDESSDMSE